ncbi:hypothetical protein F503_06051 [Ophiostoma piceae UAMH 11346]|uniref:Uncharacterized protein n=1 Tax=Ophiostoma piceae (strain UAMH 11346) TaxID=1262450 RepID=S3CFM5_OPHP1|nr:hypothetical protein F503_06051 [Ophiostoma piceae UAMH 11346]
MKNTEHAETQNDDCAWSMIWSSAYRLSRIHDQNVVMAQGRGRSSQGVKTNRRPHEDRSSAADSTAAVFFFVYGSHASRTQASMAMLVWHAPAAFSATLLPFATLCDALCDALRLFATRQLATATCDGLCRRGVL